MAGGIFGSTMQTNAPARADRGGFRYTHTVLITVAAPIWLRKRKTPVANPNLMAINRNVTSYDVAARASVSQSAVSRCFRPGASVSSATRARIMKAAK